ncbi:AMP-binding protein [Nanchangia anserum]|nr:AMP-binding protein [Nanchangia anserum]QOX81549.1 AMP-binding protein [Nanchangia anserum]
MTETGGGCVYDGVPLRGTKVATVNTRIWISGTTLMEGYLDDPDAAALVASGGRRWLRTTDCGRMVGAKLEVTGRADAVINTGGVKVNPGLVEDCLRTLPAVEDVCVVALPHSEWGQVVTAVFVPSADAEPAEIAAMRRRSGRACTDEAASSPELKDAMAAMSAAIRGTATEAGTAAGEDPTASGEDEAMSEEERDRDIAVRMRAHVAAELGRAQAPRIVCMVDALPLMGIGKVDRRRVQALAQAEVRANRAWVR